MAGALLLMLTALTGCTNRTEVPALWDRTVDLTPTESAPVESESATGEPAPGGAEVAAPATATTVLDAQPGAASAIAVSAALFRHAPVVLVAGEKDADGIG